jgi:hypothetical protein
VARKRNPWGFEGTELQKSEDRKKADGLEWNGESWVPSKSMFWNGEAYVSIEDGANRSPSCDVSESEIEIAQPRVECEPTSS